MKIEIKNKVKGVCDIPCPRYSDTMIGSVYCVRTCGRGVYEINDIGCATVSCEAITDHVGEHNEK